jgi:beta-lactam-binding protein with PASTA domain
MVDRLDARFGGEAVFRDVDDIDYGANFRDRIHQGLEATSVMLVVIGPRWLDATDDAGRRLDNQDDPLRIEVSTGLRSDVTVIPVLVRGARMPRRSDLPEELAGLANLNAIQVRRDPDFGPDMDRLIAAVEKAAPELVPSSFPTALLKQPIQVAKGGKPHSQPMRLLLMAAALAAVIAIVWGAVVLVTGGPRLVPDVVGLEEAAARAQIVGAGLTATSETTPALVAEGLVISSSPAVDTELEEGAQVTLLVSGGPIVVPDVRNRSQVRASDRIRDAGLTVRVEREGSNDVSEGFVIRHEPPEGAAVAPEAVVTIFISMGPVVPDVSLVGSDIARARVAGVVGNDDVNTIRIADESVASDLVIRTEPPAGARAIGSVTLFVSSGPPPPPTVPDLAGKPEAEAVEVLRGATYGYDVAIVATSSRSSPGLVVATDPEAGEPLAVGGSVSLLVSSGWTPIVPDLAGKPLDEATASLRAAEVMWELRDEASGSVPAQSVIRTEPPGGTVISGSTTVVVVVANGPPTNNAPRAVITPTEVEGVEGEPVVLDASASSDGDGELVRFLWDFGDGVVGTGVQARHTYTSVGSFAVTLTVEDDDGSTSVATATVTIIPAPRSLGGAFTVQETFLADLETGTTENVEMDADFWFQAVTAEERFITPVNGATMALVGPAGEFPSREFCESVEFSEDAIAVGGLAPGVHVCMQTNEGRVAAFRVEADVGPSPGELVIRFVVWEL